MSPANWIVTDARYARSSLHVIGGKAAGLGLIRDVTAPVPPSFCVTTSALVDAVARSTPEPLDPERVPEVVRNLTVPEDLGELIREHLAALPRRADGRLSLAVRSSFVSEDGGQTTSAGLYYSEVGLTNPAQVIQAVRRVWASGYIPEALAYRSAHALPPYELGMAVVIQHAPVPVVGGVAYTMLPDSNDPTTVVVEYADGSPAEVVGARKAVTTCEIDKRTRHIRGTPFNAGRLGELVDWSLRLERARDAPMDIEWLVDEDGRLWVLQARPMRHPVSASPPGAYVADARGTTLRSPKLTPYRLSATASITTIQATLILPEAFAAFKARSSQAPLDVIAACRSAFEVYLPRGPVSVRSAYWSALDSGDMMPQSGMLTTADDCLGHVLDFWRFVMERHLDDYTAEVALLVCNWTDLGASVIATVPDASAGGIATVSALYGQFAGLESCAHDVYEIDLDTGYVHRDVVPVKPAAVLTPGQPPEPVPAELRTAQVLDQGAIDAIGRSLAAVRQAFGPARVELLVLRGDATADRCVVMWQVSPLSVSDSRLRYFAVRPSGDAPTEASGTLVPVDGPDDVRTLSNDPGLLIYLNFVHAGFRDPAQAVALMTQLKRAGCPVLLRGSLLSHFAALLRDYGITVYPILESLDGIPTGSRVDLIPFGEG